MTSTCGRNTKLTIHYMELKEGNTKYWFVTDKSMGHSIHFRINQTCRSSQSTQKP